MGVTSQSYIIIRQKFVREISGAIRPVEVEQVRRTQLCVPLDRGCANKDVHAVNGYRCSKVCVLLRVRSQEPCVHVGASNEALEPERCNEGPSGTRWIV